MPRRENKGVAARGVNAADPASSRKAPRSLEDRESSSVQMLLAVFLLMSVLWGLTIPLPATRVDATAWDGFNPDEQIHMRYIAYIATQLRLPIPWIGTAANGSDLYTALHPPLYHVLGAIFYGVVKPLFGYGAAVYTMRFVGAIVGAGTVYLTYRVARRLLPHDISLLSAAIVAGVPMFASLSASATNEIAAAFAASGALLMLVSGLAEGFDRRRALLAGVWIAAGIAIKVTNVALILPALAAIALAPPAVREASSSAGRSRLLNALMVILVPAVAIGWWFIRNWVLYGDPLQAGIHYEFWSKTVEKPWWTIMSTQNFYWNSTFLGWESFWGVFDAFSRPMPADAFYVILALQIPAVAGLFYFVARHRLRERILWRTAVVLSLFAVLVLAVFYATNWRIYAPQGRYLFPLMTPFGIATAVGWTAFWKDRWRPVAIGLALTLLFFLNVFALVVMPIRPVAH